MASILLNRHRLRAPELSIPGRAPVGPTILNRTHPLARGLVGWWPLNEGSGSIAYDVSGNSNNGTLYNIDTWGSGPFGGNVPYFDGADSYINFGNILNLGTGDWTISLWFKTSDTNFSLISKSKYAVSNARWWVGWADTAPRSGFVVASTVLDTTVISGASDDVWHNMIISFDRSAYTYQYFDGAEEGSKDISAYSAYTLSNGFDLLLGRYNSTTGIGPHPTALKFNGYATELRFYNRILSADERRKIITHPYEILQPPGPEYLAFSTGGAIVLSIADLAHAHALDNVALTQAQVLAIADSTHAHTLDNVALTQAQVLAIANALHAHGLDAMTLQTGDTLIIAGLDHAHTLDPANLVQAQVLAIADVLHTHTLDGITLDLGEVTLVISDLLHAHLLDACNVYPVDSVDTPAGRVFLIEHESRIFAVAAESRIFQVQ